MTLVDASASTAFAALRPSMPTCRGSGVTQHPPGGRRVPEPSAATRLGSIDLTPHAQGEKRSGAKLPKPLFSFGVIADVQYADQDDGWNYAKEFRRYYRGGLTKLKRAVDVWLRDETHRFALQLGDVIDGSNKGQGKSDAALSSVKAEVDRLAASLPLGVLNSLGNHELYNFPKQRWARKLDCSNLAKAVTLRPPAASSRSAVAHPTPLPLENLAETNDDVDVTGPARAGSAGPAADESTPSERKGEDYECFYYSFCPEDSYRFIALDSYDVNAILEESDAHVRASGNKAEAESDGGSEGGTEILSRKNPNENKNNSSGMEGLERRFVQYNGGVGAKQLLWLEDQLTEASRAGQRVIGFGHVPIHPAEPSEHVLLWNYEDVLRVMHKFDCVAMFLSGHRHRETYVLDKKGIHHVSLAAALEAPPDQEAFASVDVYADCVELRGYGVVESRTLAFTSLAAVL